MVDLDVENNQVTVGGGATYGQLYDPLYKAGKEIRRFPSYLRIFVLGTSQLIGSQ